MRAAFSIDAHRRIGPIDPMIYGQYFEHVEDCIYDGVSSDDPAITDDRGLRTDVIDIARDMNVPITRWPGGCFADIYNWEDGIGPRDQRPKRLNWYWGGTESNRFGTDEFLHWCELTGSLPYVNVNMGSGTLREAIQWLDYCNGTADTHDVLRRKSNGRSEPYGVTYWGIGNETWGWWEPGHTTADQYGHQLREWAQFFKKVDPAVKVLGVGQLLHGDLAWNEDVLRRAGRQIDYLTVHGYAHTTHLFEPDDYYPTVTYARYFEDYLRQTVEQVNALVEALNLPHPIQISLDEWNIRHMDKPRDEAGRVMHDRPPMHTRATFRPLKDALFVAGVFHAMHRLSPHVAMACYVFLVNGNAVLNTRGREIVKSVLYDVFKVYRRLFSGVALDVQKLDNPTFLTPVRQGFLESENREVDYVDVSASLGSNDGSDNIINVAIINRHREASIDVTLHMPDGFTPHAIHTLHNDDVLAVNTFDQPDRVRMQTRLDPPWKGEMPCPPHSLTVLEFRKS